MNCGYLFGSLLLAGFFFLSLDIDHFFLSPNAHSCKAHLNLSWGISNNLGNILYRVWFTILINISPCLENDQGSLGMCNRISAVESLLFKCFQFLSFCKIRSDSRKHFQREQQGKQHWDNLEATGFFPFKNSLY